MSSSLAKRYAVNTDVAENGHWVDFGDGIEARIARFDNKRSREVRRRLERPHRSGVNRNRQLSMDVEEKITIEHVAEAILLDWKGVTDEKGKAIPYNKQIGMEFLTQYSDFLNDVLTCSMDRELFRAELLEEEVKNS